MHNQEFKGTKGPWRVQKNDQDGGAKIIAPPFGDCPYEIEVSKLVQYRLASDSSSDRIAHGKNYSDDIILANANMLAAAPELLEVLEEVRDLFDVYKDLHDELSEEMKDKIRSVIKKAIG